MITLSHDLIERNSNGLDNGQVLDIGDDFDDMFGFDFIVLSDEQIEEIENGKVVRFDNREYATLVCSKSAMKERGHTFTNR